MFPQATFPRLLTLAAACLSCVAVWAQTRLVFTDAFPSESPATMTPTALSVTGFATATAEAGEPAHDGTPARNSLWARFTANQSGLFRLTRSIDATRSLRIAVYTNQTMASLGRVASVTLLGETNELRWEATAGVTYSVALDSTNSTPSVPSISFSTFFVRSIPDRPLEAGEVVRLEAVSTDPATVFTELTFYKLDGYSGTLGGGGNRRRLVTLTNPPWSMSFTNHFGGLAEITADAPQRLAPARLAMKPPGDLLAAAVELPESFSVYSTSRGLPLASVEAGEFLPQTNQMAGTPASVWWRWRPAFTARTSVGSSPQGLWAVYANGTASSNLVAPSSGFVFFTAEAGKTYFLQMVVGGNPTTHPVNQVNIKRDVLTVLPPVGSVADVSLGGGSLEGFLSASRQVEVGVTNLHPAESLVGYRLNNQSPDRFTAGGFPVFAVDLGEEGVGLLPSATNQAGLRLKGPGIYLAARPTNDLVISASLLSERDSYYANGLLGTGSPDDPRALGVASHSRWWFFSAPGNTKATIHVERLQESAATIAVFRGFPGVDSTPLALASGNALYLTLEFNVATGETYYVVADVAGPFSIDAVSFAPLAWLGIPDRVPIGTTLSATLALAYPGGNARPPYRVRLGTQPEQVFTAVPQVVELSSQTPGKETLWVEYYSASGGQQWLKHEVTFVQPNDDFASARQLVGDPGDFFFHGGGYDSYSTVEAGEPLPFEGQLGSLWYRWAPQKRIRCTFEAHGLNTQFAIFEGTNLAQLSLVATAMPESPQTNFLAEAGKEYWIQASRRRLDWAEFSFSITVPNSNDNFADAWLLEPGNSQTGITEFATAEPGEPAHDGTQARKSLWWRLNVPRRSEVELLVGYPLGAPRPPIAAVYSGETLATLVPVAVDRRAGGESGFALKWMVDPATPHYLAVDSEVPFQLPVFAVVQVVEPLSLTLLRINDEFFGRTVTLHWSSVPGRTYRVESSAQLGNGWHAEWQGNADGFVMEMTFTVPNQEQLFFQVVEPQTGLPSGNR